MTLATTLTLLGLTGCSVPSHGWVGLLRGEGESLIAVVQMCEESVDGATIYTGDGAGEQTIALAEFGTPVTDTGAVELATLENLDTEVTHRVYGWTDSATSSADGPDFTRDDIARVEPGNVLAIDLYADDYTARSFTREAFEAMVLDHCDE